MGLHRANITSNFGGNEMGAEAQRKWGEIRENGRNKKQRASPKKKHMWQDAMLVASAGSLQNDVPLVVLFLVSPKWEAHYPNLI